MFRESVNKSGAVRTVRGARTSLLNRLEFPKIDAGSDLKLKCKLEWPHKEIIQFTEKCMHVNLAI